MHDFNEQFSIQKKIEVAWGDMDAMNHVNNARYFRYFETSRILYFSTMNLRLADTSCGPILAAIECQYLRPLQYPDQILVGTRATHIGNTSFSMDHAIYSETQAAIVAKGQGRVVFYDYQKQEKVPVPDSFRTAVQDFDKNFGKT